jgi:hypothetical protein
MPPARSVLPRPITMFGRRLALSFFVPLLLATACADTDPVSSADDEVNYRSTAGQEFSLSTSVTFAVPEAATLEGDAKEAAIVARAEEIRGIVTKAISSELDRIWPEDQRLTRAGLAIQFRQASASYADLTRDGDSFTILVSGEFAAVKDVEAKLPLTTGADGKRYLPVSARLDAEPTALQVAITPVERSRNSYPKYLELFDDGLDVGVHFGGDHNTPPKDVLRARSFYDDLVTTGFTSPVARFEDLKIDSPPLTRTIKVKGNDVAVRVRLYHVDMTAPDARQPLIDAYKYSMKNADVVVYDGHAGRSLGYSGVVLAYSPARVSITANELANIESADKQQVYLFNGCETYTGYADKLYENPMRTPENTDVITAANYTAIQRQANQVIAFIHSFVDQPAGQWVPRTWDSVLEKMNAAGERSWVHVYGVHGIDDNPKASPIADVSKVGSACTSDAQCGAPDSRCLLVSPNRRVCGIACADSAGCPGTTKCVFPRGRTGVDDLQCAPQ